MVSIRPEAIAPAADHAPANRVEGTLDRLTYLGDLVLYHVEVPGVGELVMQRQSGGHVARQWRVGERVELGWDEDSALVLHDDAHVADEDDRHFIEARRH